jgi:hypothetical protein
LREIETHRDAGKPTDRPQPHHATLGAMALNVREAVSGKLIYRGL